ncbi:hypothetical protein OE88DRAFT_1316294 [Heliocybe sulcata]|uniref:F-box domain-containing protein n=1 Tax=Heliocybe sulcata TaxID=5364 RepID=A0A5C3N5I8_9AGAM|nr:hypothetical protein OE88DRAFT_1316294 [Heliocybe sulcata]
MPIDFSLLPYDILVLICASVTHRQTLVSCSLVCRSFREAAQPTLYRDIVFTDAGSPSCVFRILEDQPHLRSYVRSATHITTCLATEKDTLWDEKKDRKPKWPNPLSRLSNLESYTLLPAPPSPLVDAKNFDFLLCLSCVLSRFEKLRRVHFAVNMDRMAMSLISGLLLHGQLSGLTFGRTELGALSQLTREPEMIQSFSSIRELHIMVSRWSIVLSGKYMACLRILY